MSLIRRERRTAARCTGGLCAGDRSRGCCSARLLGTRNARLFLVLVDLGAAEERGTRPIGAARRADGFPIERLFLPLDFTAAVGQMQAFALLGLAHLALIGIVWP